jgi:hypothetical protein
MILIVIQILCRPKFCHSDEVNPQLRKLKFRTLRLLQERLAIHHELTYKNNVVSALNDAVDIAIALPMGHFSAAFLDFGAILSLHC